MLRYFNFINQCQSKKMLFLMNRFCGCCCERTKDHNGKRMLKRLAFSQHFLSMLVYFQNLNTISITPCCILFMHSWYNPKYWLQSQSWLSIHREIIPTEDPTNPVSFCLCHASIFSSPWGKKRHKLWRDYRRLLINGTCDIKRYIYIFLHLTYVA